jgi:hypothetical protein
MTNMPKLMNVRAIAAMVIAKRPFKLTKVKWKFGSVKNLSLF